MPQGVGYGANAKMGGNPLGGLLQMLMQRKGGTGRGGVGGVGGGLPQMQQGVRPPGPANVDPRQRLRRLLMSRG